MEAEKTEISRITILKERQGEAEKIVAKARRKAAKMGQAKITYVFDNEHTVEKVVEDFDGRARKVKVEMIDIVVSGRLPRFDGWEFVAKIESTSSGILLKCAPGKEGALAFVQGREDFDAKHCDHCGTRRGRKETFVVRHADGEIKQIGRNCIMAFLGCTDPSAILQHLRFMLTGAGSDDFESFSRFPGPVVMAKYIMPMAVADVRQRGFRSSQYNDSTKERCTGIFLQMSKINKERILTSRALLDSVTEEDRAEAESVFEWVESVEAKDEYIHNLKTLLSADVIPNFWRNAGLVVSAAQAYRRAMGTIEERKRAAELPNAFVGVEGERLRGLNLTLKKKINCGRSEFFPHPNVVVFVFSDAAGNVLTWKTTSAPDIDVDQSITADASVKRHKVYEREGDSKKINQTQLTRLKVKP